MHCASWLFHKGRLSLHSWQTAMCPLPGTWWHILAHVGTIELTKFWEHLLAETAKPIATPRSTHFPHNTSAVCCHGMHPVGCLKNKHLEHLLFEHLFHFHDVSMYLAHVGTWITGPAMWQSLFLWTPRQIQLSGSFLSTCNWTSKQGWGWEKALNLSVSAPLTNCNVATCWHVELSTLNLLLLWLNIYLSNQ